jgi:hypothetical protein
MLWVERLWQRVLLVARSFLTVFIRPPGWGRISQDRFKSVAKTLRSIRIEPPINTTLERLIKETIAPAFAITVLSTAAFAGGHGITEFRIGILGGTIDMAWLGASAYAATFLQDEDAVEPVFGESER